MGREHADEPMKSSRFSSASSGAHVLLDVAGMVEVFGQFADFARAYGGAVDSPRLMRRGSASPRIGSLMRRQE